MKFNRIILIILDSLGVGELPDADKFGDVGSNTLANVAKVTGGIFIPHLQALGLCNIIPVEGVRPVAEPVASFGKMAEKSVGKDTTTGHWEIAGIVVKEPFSLFPNGFPPEIIDEFKKHTGTDILGNYPASGTEIIEKLGEEHISTGKPIIYTSADSVFQIAAHENVIPLEKLYDLCEIARKIADKHNISRVIARPFTGKPGWFYRTHMRKDFSVPPSQETVLDILAGGGIDIISVGKVESIFCGRGISRSVTTKNNLTGIIETIDLMKDKQLKECLIFTNLLDFDTLYGHRNDPVGYRKCLEEFDQHLPFIIDAMRRKDLLLITADHGCDPTILTSTDHTREYVPLLAFSHKKKLGVDLGIRESFSDVAATIAENFGYSGIFGKSFLEEIL